ncbi:MULTISPECIES: efflux RND transporter periplasmic adaptor subunit [Pseudomonas]|jgi:RND family efflux transporter MFP subunit|uniref:Efflux RND transporter periplasmic adaptor subunit n=1 Tax=Pseudomonas juntendi TaxID=2666183 RepID=A0ABD4YI67_9PSED|nr:MULTISPECIES: efflux RND transporter periplasmic adaptor subunit [Pseudomonas]MBH3373945.1 efflux RND transporter periplasmic adaptor subunit [Pseudomonas juntendi]MBS6040857.1 efflux RND transporter periplasmic adaptor subunit [Pseudomonas sp.]MDH0759136.1 efflux RND transporter periplasmic adaptor subunit [Pseudomonas juntendi]MDH1922573.1 efflux RND transporter periplasmic adaptor subunit [Pseudomonas juntendi]RRV54367.1 efflux RND transporter periplasmic adaptor subunit [Pseudomonas sp.
MRRPFRSALLAALVLLILVAAGTWYTQRQPAPAARSQTAIPVRVVTVVQRDVPRYASAIGSVLSLHSVEVRPQVEGVLTQVLVKEGQWVKQGDLLATLDDRAIQAQLDQARALLGQSQAQIQVAAVDLRRYRLLSRDNGVSRQQLDQQQALVNQLQATVKGNQAAIANAQVQLSYTRIRSLVTGRVGIRNVDPGNLVRTSDTQGLFSVTQIDPIAVEFALPQQMLPTLQRLLTAPAPALVQAYMDADGERSLLGEGHLALIDNQVSATTGTVRVKAEFDNKDGRLWPGQLVTVRLRTAVQENALVVPPPVVQRGVDGHFVYRLDGDKVTSVPVKVLYQDSELNVIAGVKPGERLVLDGQSRLKPGSRVEVSPDAPTAPAMADQRSQP